MKRIKPGPPNEAQQAEIDRLNALDRLNAVGPSLWENNLIQFARLLCEINATVDLTLEDWSSLSESMDLSIEDVDELFERAHIVWEKAKEDFLR